MSELVQTDPVDTGTLLLEIYEGGSGELFLRIGERPAKSDYSDDYREACLSADEARYRSAGRNERTSHIASKPKGESLPHDPGETGSIPSAASQPQ